MGTTHRKRRPITDANLHLLHRLHAGDSAAFGDQRPHQGADGDPLLHGEKVAVLAR